MEIAFQFSRKLGYPGAESKTIAWIGRIFPVSDLNTVQRSTRLNAPPLLKRWIKRRGCAAGLDSSTETRGLKSVRREDVGVVM